MRRVCPFGASAKSALSWDHGAVGNGDIWSGSRAGVGVEIWQVKQSFTVFSTVSCIPPNQTSSRRSAKVFALPWWPLWAIFTAWRRSALGRTICLPLNRFVCLRCEWVTVLTHTSSVLWRFLCQRCLSLASRWREWRWSQQLEKGLSQFFQWPCPASWTWRLTCLQCDEDIHLRFSLLCCWETVGLDVDWSSQLGCPSQDGSEQSLCRAAFSSSSVQFGQRVEREDCWTSWPGAGGQCRQRMNSRRCGSWSTQTRPCDGKCFTFRLWIALFCWSEGSARKLNYGDHLESEPQRCLQDWHLYRPPLLFSDQRKQELSLCSVLLSECEELHHVFSPWPLCGLLCEVSQFMRQCGIVVDGVSTTKVHHIMPRRLLASDAFVGVGKLRMVFSFVWLGLMPSSPKTWARNSNERLLYSHLSALTVRPFSRMRMKSAHWLLSWSSCESP